MLGPGRLPVWQLVDALHWPQPTVSKHLAVLLKVGLVKSTRQSRQMLYEIDPQGLRTIHDWTRRFERLWSDQLVRIKARAQAKVAGEVKPETVEPTPASPATRTSATRRPATRNPTRVNPTTAKQKDDPS